MIGEAEILDPVSGNDVPPGSLPEEVRDDIDARLSEGEYVVPADVVRYFGVKFFEDLRSQAKMGLQQMDADGRIGGDPIPPEDSMEIAELKAELSESGMYAGGLTDGGGLDIFIDDASRSPMVNGRMRARGATVNMAVGGLAVGNYGDVTKVDGIIQKLMTAANKDPALMQKLASKGIKINNTSADKKSAEMKQANKPQEPTDPVKMQEGGLMDTVPKTNPFLKKYSTVGGTAFEPMLDDFEDMNDEDKAALEAFTDPSGVIKEVFLVDAEGNKFTVAWNTAMPVPEGFTLEEIPEGFNATEPVYPAGTVINPVVQTERRTGDDGPNFPEAFSTSGSTGRSGNLSTSGLSSAALIGIDTDYKNMETGDLEAAYETLEKRFGKYEFPIEPTKFYFKLNEGTNTRTAFFYARVYKCLDKKFQEDNDGEFKYFMVEFINHKNRFVYEKSKIYKNEIGSIQLFKRYLTKVIQNTKTKQHVLITYAIEL